MTNLKMDFTSYPPQVQCLDVERAQEVPESEILSHGINLAECVSL
jgi:hypothetical protein